MIVKYTKYLICWAILLGACACGKVTEADAGKNSHDTKSVITIATAANVQFAMEELIEAFEAQSTVRVEAVMSSSGKLAAQILEGAPYDLFVSADVKYPKYLIKEQAAVGEVKPYAYGTLVVCSHSAIDIAKLPEFLLEGATAKIAIPNPRNAPYGEQALRYLEYYALLDQLEHKLVYGESIAQTNQYILSKATDIGFTAKSAVLASAMRSVDYWAELPDSTYTPIQQGVVITQYGQSNHAHESLAFYNFLFSESGRTIFKKYGYRLPDQESVQ